MVTLSGSLQSVTSIIPKWSFHLIDRLKNPNPEAHIIRAPFLPALRGHYMPRPFSPVLAPDPADLEPNSPAQAELIKFFAQMDDHLASGLSLAQGMPVFEFARHTTPPFGPPKLEFGETYNNMLNTAIAPVAVFHITATLAHQLYLMLLRQQSPESPFTSSKKTTDLSVNDGHSCDFIAEKRGGEWRIIGWLDQQPRAFKTAVLQSWLTKHTRDQGPPGLDIFTEENTVPLESIPDKYGHKTRAPARIGAPQRSERSIAVDELSASDLGSQDSIPAVPNREDGRGMYRDRMRGPKRSGANAAPLENTRWPITGTVEAPRTIQQDGGVPPVRRSSAVRSAPPHRVS